MKHRLLSFVRVLRLKNPKVDRYLKNVNMVHANALVSKDFSGLQC